MGQVIPDRSGRIPDRPGSSSLRRPYTTYYGSIFQQLSIVPVVVVVGSNSHPHDRTTVATVVATLR